MNEEDVRAQARAVIEDGKLVVKPSHLVVHLSCFFNPPSARGKSLGAAASMPTLRARHRAVSASSR